MHTTETTPPPARRARLRTAPVAGMLLLLLAGLSAGPLWAQPPLSGPAAQRLQEISAQLDPQALVAPPQVVDCVLSGGAKTQCVSITVKQAPSTVRTGPWCPRHTSDGADQGGIWLDQGQVHAVSGAFIQHLATFYKDPAWQMFDAGSGAVKFTNSAAACAAAARPDVDPKYQNHCVECQTSYLAADASATYVIPLQPVAATATAEAARRAAPRPGRPDGAAGPAGRAGPPGGGGGGGGGQPPVGLSFSGLRLEAAAPVQAILAAHTLAPFDPCGGHVNLHVGYHVHAVTDCMKTVPAKAPDHAPVIGLALDGWPLHARAHADGQEPADLDHCRGHHTAALGYHYHVAAPGANAILSCHVAQTGCALDEAGQACDASATPARPNGPPPQRR